MLELRLNFVRLLAVTLAFTAASVAAQGQDNDLVILQGPPTQLIVKELQFAELPCAYKIPSDATSVQLRWRKDGKVLRQISLSQEAAPTTTPTPAAVGIQPALLEDARMPREDARIVLSKQNGSLLFSSVLASDAGQYSCQLMGEGYAAVTSAAANLKIVEMLKFTPQPTSKNLELGTLGKVHCKAQGTPTPQVKWLKTPNLPLPAHVIDANGTLIFRNVSNEQRGNYTCHAHNTQGQINATVAINVVVAPKFTLAPPQSPLELDEQESVVIHCQATGDPEPTVQWDKDLIYLNENNTDGERFLLHENGTLEISAVHVEDEGRYGCTIGSSAGFKRAEVWLIVKTAKSSSNSIVTRSVIIIICLAFLYFVLVLGLKLWYRYRRAIGKVNLNDGENVEAGVENAENEPCLTEANSSKNPSITKSKKLRESVIMEQESSQVADDIV